MWRTPNGDRTLIGAEAALIRAAALDLMQSLQEETDDLNGEFPCGVKLFDELSWQQRLALLARVASALLDSNVAPPQLSAVNEATVAALFAHVNRNLAIELDYAGEEDLPPEYDKHCWRRLIAACQEAPNEEFNLKVDSTEASDWDDLIQALQDQILWDADWDMPELFMDAAPELSRRRKYRLGILEDYFTAPAPELREAEVPEAFESLERLLFAE